MSIFAFIGHYTSVKHSHDFLGGFGSMLSRLPHQIQKDVIRFLPPYQFLKIPLLHSAVGGSTQGFAIIVPLIPEHIATLGEHHVLKKIIAGGRLAERLGARLVGLAGFTSIVGNEGEELRKYLRIEVTSGNSLTAALALQGLRKAAQLMGIEMRTATAAIIGATGDIGSACTRVLATKVRKLRLAARNPQRLEELVASIENGSNCEIQVTRYVSDAVRNADLVLTATSAYTTLIEPKDVKPGAVVCDVAIPHNVGTDLLRCRNDVLVFEGGLARLPVQDGDYLGKSRKWKAVAPDGVTIFGCLAETIVLALEGRWESFSLGRGNITAERIREIGSLAARHGFELAQFRYGDVVFDRERLDMVRANAANRFRRARATEVVSPPLPTIA